MLSNPIARIAAEADHVWFTGGGFDSELVGELGEEMARIPEGGKAVIFLHMEGSHFGYVARYPASFDHFRDGQGAPRQLPERQSRLVDEYDNTVYFTDHNVRAVIDKLAQCHCRSGLVFFSDHGERLFDNGLTDNDFGHGFPTISRQEIEIPFFVWMSSAYQEANPGRIEQLRANAGSVAQLHNLFETLVDLAGVDYHDRASSLSLFSDKFRSPLELDVLNMDQDTVAFDVAGPP